jgi:hypothetical protein
VRRARRAVCVSADDRLPAGSHPVDDPSVNAALLPDVGREACAAPHAEALEVLESAHGPPAHDAQPIALEIGLVSVDDKDLLARLCVIQDQPFVRDEPIFLHAMALAILYVVVAHDQVQSLPEVKLGKQVKDATVSTLHVAKPPILPQLVAIPDLNIRKPVLKVVIESVEKELFVLGKGVRPAIVPAMAVAKEYDPRGIIKRHPLGGLKYLCQPSVRSSARLVLERLRTPPRQCSPRCKTRYHAWLTSPFELVFPFYHLSHTAWVNLS